MANLSIILNGAFYSFALEILQGNIRIRRSLINDVIKLILLNNQTLLFLDVNH